MITTISEMFNFSTVTRICFSVSGLGVTLIKNFFKFWIGIILLGLTLISAVEFVWGTAIMNAYTSWTRFITGQIHFMTFVENASYVVLGIGFTLVVAGIAFRTFWGFWRIK